jgi:circadian clock protein KaiB
MDPLASNDANGNLGQQKTYLHLYVANDSPNSLRAIANLEAICKAYFQAGTYQITIIDILKDPLRALDDGILVTPTLIRLAAPSRRVIGDLSDHEQVLYTLGLAHGSD